MRFFTPPPVFDATAPVTQAVGDAAAVGTAITVPHRDHKHGMPATYTPAAHGSTHPAAGSDAAFPGCSAVTNAPQTINSTTSTAVAFAAEQWDDAAFHDNVTNNSRMTIPTTGRYVVIANIIWDAQTLGVVTELVMFITVNGSELAGSRVVVPPTTSFAALAQGMCITKELNLNATDYVEVKVYHDKTAAGTLTIGTSLASTFSIRRT